MPLTRAIATPFGVSTDRENLTAGEVTARTAEETAHAAAVASAPRQISKTFLMGLIPESNRNDIVAYCVAAAADDQHTDYTVAKNYLNKLWTQDTFNVNSQAWTSAIAWLLSRSLIDQATHDALAAI